MKVLITSGGTREPIDAARSVTNTSTGGTGSALAEFFAARGSAVLCLCAAGAVKPAGAIRVKEFSTFTDLDMALKQALKTEAFDAVIHLAAVSDYSPALIEAGGRTFLPGREAKLDSAPEEIRVTLRRNFKIIDRIKGYAAAGSNPEPLLIGFKLTSGAATETVINKVRALACADLVVHNDLAEIAKTHPFHLYRNGAHIADCAGAERLASLLYRFIDTALPKDREKHCRDDGAAGLAKPSRRSTLAKRGDRVAEGHCSVGRRAHGVRDAVFCAPASPAATVESR